MSEPKGRILLLIIKSSMSRIVEPAPRGVIPDHKLKPRAQGTDKRVTAKKLIRHAFLRLILNWSILKDMIFSNTAITVETAANIIKRKKKEPQPVYF